MQVIRPVAVVAENVKYVIRKGLGTNTFVWLASIFTSVVSCENDIRRRIRIAKYTLTSMKRDHKLSYMCVTVYLVEKYLLQQLNTDCIKYP